MARTRNVIQSEIVRFENCRKKADECIKEKRKSNYYFSFCCSEDGTNIIFSSFFLNFSNNTLKHPINRNLQISLIQIDKLKNNKIKQIVGIISGFY